MKKLAVFILLLALFALCIFQCKDQGQDFYGGDTSVVPAVGHIPDRVELADQIWNRQTRDDFWWTSQGAKIIPYSWFVWLEMANDTSLFRSAAHMDSLRYLPSASSKLNPGGLPIGFTISDASEGEGHWLGLTCAACHTNQVDYKGTKMLIEGAPTLANFPLFFGELVLALNATNEDNAKFDRFARRVLGRTYNAAKADSLREYLVEVTLTTAERQEVNSLDTLPHDLTSYARLDAFGEIQNAGTAFALHDLNNKNVPSAPVSYPFLWGTHQSDVVQWNASAKNTPVIGPLVRNVGEVVGVFGNLSIDKEGNRIKYSSSVNFHNLGELEKWVKELGSPGWPERYLPAIDLELAARGAPLFAKNCSTCHQVIPREEVPTTHYVANKTRVDRIKTDPATAEHAAFYRAKTLALEGTKTAVLFGDPFPDSTAAISIPVNGVIGLVLKDPLKAIEAGLIPYEDKSTYPEDVKSLIEDIEQFVAEHKREKEATQDELNQRVAQLVATHVQGQDNNLVYKGRPLNGIWATAPFLHNGSVPNLWELLKEPHTRVDSFWVGSREFDPKHVGFDTESGLNMFRVKNKKGKIQFGNSNRGHAYGTKGWTDAEKWAVIEYMKTL